jgi:hypothetical protein
MTSFTTGFTVGDKDFRIFSIDPYSSITPIYAAEVGVAMAELRDKVNQDPEHLREVFVIHRRLIDVLKSNAYTDLDKPAHTGVDYIIHAIRTSGVPVKIYFREE